MKTENKVTVTPFENGFRGELQKRKNSKSGITFDLKAAFDGMVKKGALERNGEDFSKKDALAMYNKLVEIHKKHKYSTNFTKMQEGLEYTYSADEVKELAEAAGYKLKTKPENQNINIKS